MLTVVNVVIQLLGRSSGVSSTLARNSFLSALYNSKSQLDVWPWMERRLEANGLVNSIERSLGFEMLGSLPSRLAGSGVGIMGLAKLKCLSGLLSIASVELLGRSEDLKSLLMLLAVCCEESVISFCSCRFSLCSGPVFTDTKLVSTLTSLTLRWYFAGSILSEGVVGGLVSMSIDLFLCGCI